MSDDRERPTEPVHRPDADALRDVPVQRGGGAPAPRAAKTPRDDVVDGATGHADRGVSPDAIEASPARTSAPDTRPPAPELPRTTEKPGTGSRREPPNDFPYTREKQPVPGQEQRYRPRPDRERPTGQITDEKGEWGPERTWYDGDGETDWKKMNRAPALIIGGAIVLGLGLGVMNRPAAVGGVASTAPTARATASAPAAIDTYEMGPLKVVRDANSTTSRYTIDVFAVPPGEYKWTLDAPCGSIGSVQLGALVGWSYDNNTKTCPPGPQGPFPGKVTLTFTSATDGKVYTWTAGSETGSYGERFTIK